MNGALFFLADLLRAIEVETEISCVRLASYEGRASTGKLRGLGRLEGDFAGRDVLVVDDILDSGLTLAPLAARLRELGAADVKICVLLQKNRRRVRPVRADWIGFRIADEFVVGYGLDFNGRYRGLKEVRLLEPTPAPRRPKART
jgi:hypoxanthine phosphoribosyltransferase